MPLSDIIFKMTLQFVDHEDQSYTFVSSSRLTLWYECSGMLPTSQPDRETLERSVECYPEEFVFCS